MGEAPTDEARYADWLARRLGALVPSIERFLALMADPRSADPDWRERVWAEFEVWSGAGAGDSPPVPPELKKIDRRLRVAADALDGAALMFRKAIDADDGALAARAFDLLYATERSARGLAAETMRAWPRIWPR